MLDELAAALDGSRYTLILADQNALLVDIRYGRDAMRSALDEVGAVVGGRFTEAATGTNSIATALELRRGLSVHGSEHYLESFRRFACYGLPITDPATRRNAGVLDITCLEEDASELLRPFLLRGVRDIEARLLGDTRRAHRRMLAAFDAAALATSDALVGLAADLVLTNDAAAELLEPADHAALQSVALDMERMRRRTWRCAFELNSGVQLELEATVLDGGVLVRLMHGRRTAPVRRRRRVDASPDWHAPLERDLARYRAAGSSVLVHGEPGTGRRTVARRLTTEGPLERGGHGSTIELDGPSVSPNTVGDIPPGTRTVLITDADLLSEEVAALVERRVARDDLRLVLTTTATALKGHVAMLVARCPVRLELPTLRSRRDRIPGLATALLRERNAGLRLTPNALRVLASQDWPGNLRELISVIEHLADLRSTGDLTEADLPPGYRVLRRATPGAMEQAERDAIIEALRECDGNKVHAAAKLGISRTTLYKHIRMHRIDVAALRLGSDVAG
ncbi:sigma-54-dependent Fis family transcriptional regulator [Prauserella oleivorans]